MIPKKRNTKQAATKKVLMNPGKGRGHWEAALQSQAGNIRAKSLGKMKAQKGCHMIKVCRETPEGRGSERLRHVLQIWEYERGTVFVVYIRKNRQIKGSFTVHSRY